MGALFRQVPAADLPACCAAASKPQPNPWGGGSDPSQSYTFFQNKTCALYHFAFSGSRCDEGISGVLPPPPPPPPGTSDSECLCKRVNQTVGREPLGSPAGGGWGGNNPAGGTWFSYPAMGECDAAAEVGDSCSWKAVGCDNHLRSPCFRSCLSSPTLGSFWWHAESKRPSMLPVYIATSTPTSKRLARRALTSARPTRHA